MKEFVEKLIGRLNNEYLKYNDGDWNSAIDESIKIVNELAEEYNNGWIPCSERLPEEDGYYLITIRFYHLHNLVVMGCNFEDGKWLYMDGDDEVLAWQPLPQPYKAGEMNVDDR